MTLPQTQRGSETRDRAEQHREAHVKRHGCGSEPVVDLADYERTDPVGDDHREEVNADSETAQLRPGDIVHVGCGRSQPDERKREQHKIGNREQQKVS